MSAFPESASLAQEFGALAEAATPGAVTLCYYGNEDGSPRTAEQLREMHRDMIAEGGPFFFAVTTGEGTLAVCEPGNGPTSEANGAFIEFAFNNRAAILRALHLAKLVDEPSPADIDAVSDAIGDEPAVGYDWKPEARAAIECLRTRAKAEAERGG